MPIAHTELGAIAAGERTLEEALLGSIALELHPQRQALKGQRRQRRKLASPLPIAEDASSPRGNLPAEHIAATKERRQ